MSSQPVSRRLSDAPTCAPTAKIHESHLGVWTEIGDRCVFNHVTLGDYSYVERDCDLMFTEVGKFTSIASSVRINPSNHPWWRPTLHHFSYRPGKFGFVDSDQGVDDRIFAWRSEDRVVVGHDVWIGHGALVLPGVTIGNGAIVGAGSVVTKDVAPYTIVVGNPARPLRPRFEDPDTVARLEALAWWDWPHARLARMLPLFQGDTGVFLETAERESHRSS